MADVITTWDHIQNGSYPLKLIDNGDGSYSLSVAGGGVPTYTSVATAFSVTDDAAIGIDVTDTTEPALPIHEWTVGTLPDGSVRDYMAIVTFGGINNGAGAVTIDGQMTLNGVDTGVPLTQLVIPAGEYFYYGFQVCDDAIVEGDVIGVKLWADVAGDVELSYSSLYIMPRTWNPVGSSITFDAANSAFFTTNIVGAVAGVTYIATNMGPSFSVWVDIDGISDQIRAQMFTSYDPMIVGWTPDGGVLFVDVEFTAQTDAAPKLAKITNVLSSFILQS